MTGSLVLLEELTGPLGNGTVEYVRGNAEAAGFDIVTDWAGRECVTDEAARALVSQYASEYQARAEKLSRYEAYRLARQRERIEVGRQAYEAASRKRFNPGAARNAQAEALIKFDKKNPELSFDEFTR
jgi:hypothetical protein